MPTPNAHRSTDTNFGLDSLLEAQTRLWNQLLDANRSFWSFYTPWMPIGAWGPSNAATANDPAESATEPATTVDGIPDPLEMQTRSWNHFLDAQRTFWTALNWQLPPTPWAVAANEDGSPRGEANVIDVEKGPVSTKAPTKKPRSGAAAKSRRSSRAARTR